MHGRLKVKTTREQEEERKIREREKAYHFRDLTERLFELRSRIGDFEIHEDILKLTTELLLTNPDFYTVWNIRREILLAHAEAQPEDAETSWTNELAFTLECLRKNEKSYSVWQHRIWVLTQLPRSHYKNEILLCNSFLAKDERNFHCWDYRSYISDIAQIDLEKEFEFTTEKIKSNFSNFSAWHRRHKLLLKGLSSDSCPESCDLRKIWKQEYDLILNALYTDPSDQSPWLYHNWLIKNNFNNLTKDELDKLKTLQELEPDNDWVKSAVELTTVRLEEK